MANGPLSSSDTLAEMNSALGAYANLQKGWHSAGMLRREFGALAAEAGAIKAVVRAMLSTQPEPN